MTGADAPTWPQAFGSTLKVIGSIAGACLVVGILLNRFVLPSATEEEILEDLEALQVALVAYRQDNAGQLPGALSDLLLPLTEESRRYINRIPTDPWGESYRYEKFPGGFRLRCLGRDKRSGGDGEDRDFQVEWREPFREDR
ncbi:MAG: type II secretion system protein GspG [Planctomycetota bacterium]